MASLPERFGDRQFSLDYALGSGTHAVTFLSLLTSGSGETLGVEHRLTWYRRFDGLGRTPGQALLRPEEELEFFGRVTDQEGVERCIGCHTTRFELRGHELHNVVAGVQCESCHGPGSVHVSAAEQDDPLLGGTLAMRPSSAADEIALCGRCHRNPETFDPELLEQYPAEFTRFQPLGLMKSRCYLESGGRLRCSTCHDPHAPVSSETREMQVSACRSCHGGGGDSVCPVAPSGGCIECHMPGVEALPGLSFHDHWIRSQPTADRSATGQ